MPSPIASRPSAQDEPTRASRMTGRYLHAMCGRYGFGNPARLEQLPLGVSLPALAPRFNVAPASDVPIVLQEGGARAATLARWGLVPFWADDPSIGNKLANARGDTVAEKPSFRAAFKARRGLMPAEFFYEWQVVPGQKTKQPWCIAVGDVEPFAFGAIWERWAKKGAGSAETGEGAGEGGEGSAPLLSCAIITTDANAVMAPIHHRMPVIIHPDDFEQWLDPRTSVETAKRLVRPYEGAMRVWRVSTRVNNGRAEGAELIEPLA